MIFYYLFLLFVITAVGQLIADFLLKKLIKNEAFTDLIAFLLSALIAYSLSFAHNSDTALFLEIFSLAYVAAFITTGIKLIIRKRKLHT
ncbi:hypothetical protein JMA_03090 [Jeotgalibacillus malaysiensis]|uniref:Uncharacterized protein n=1 Tax=Jeotgalibacillus malaysiensis TaxID=1508404 RepID=A0A0B5AHS4_9BACL|nr:hypothetical protein [Jeotgalibacillus malaysiensis]AJD89626.1 hypothetical protein JMA_03090 [Jeotgalibacillus malaysiensis]